MSVSEDLPQNVGIVERDTIVVEDCVLCGRTHRHGAVCINDGVTSRAAHCPGYHGEYEIRISGWSDE